MLSGFFRGAAVYFAAFLIYSAGGAEQPDIRRDATVVVVEGAMPSVVNISGKTVVRRQGYLYDWWRNNWAPFYQDMPPQRSELLPSAPSCSRQPFMTRLFL